MKKEPQTRPGGRTSRIREDVYEAALSLLADGKEPLTIATLAERSGVHHATIYRRWQTAEAVVLEAAAARLESRSPMPDTGTLCGDLLEYATRFAEMVQAPGGGMLLRAVLATSAPDGALSAAARTLLLSRASQIQTMLDRAAQRGESALTYIDVLDDLLSPLYIRSVYGMGGVTLKYLQQRIEKMLGAEKTH